MYKGTLLLAGCLAVLGLAWRDNPVKAPAVPEKLKVPDGQAVFLEASAEGVQIYACQASAEDAGRFAWTFKAPEAALKDGNGRTIGKHYAGPTWESTDGSKVIGQVLQQSPAPEANAIAWLLLKAKSTEGAGIFTAVTYVQRVDTEGGKPSNGCDSKNAGTETRVPYRAHYFFYRTAR
jgi:Protein of unknown function (DUF3455)